MPKNSYTLGSIPFRTQGELRNHFQWIKSRGPCVIRPNDSDFSFLHDLYSRSPYMPHSEIVAVEFLFHPTHGGRELGARLHLANATYVEFPSARYGLTTSDQEMKDPWVKWDRLLEQKLYSKMRLMVKYQIETYRLSHDTGRCAICNALGEEVDHCGEYEFRSIRDMWLGSVDCSRLNIIDDTPDSSNPEFCDPDMYGDWLDFHSRYAEYQLLCASCHRKKSAAKYQLVENL